MANGDPTLELAKEGIKQALAPLQNLIQRLFGPCADEIGLSLADSARVWRMRRAIRLLEKVQAMTAGLRLKPVEPRLLFLILDAGSLEDDEELQQRWAALLTNAATVDFGTEILPSFPDILRQLTSTEARFLEKIDAEVSKDDARTPELQIIRASGRLRKETLESASPVMLGNLQRLGLLTLFPRTDWGDGTVNQFGATNYMYLSPFGKAFVRACRQPR